MDGPIRLIARMRLSNTTIILFKACCPYSICGELFAAVVCGFLVVVVGWVVLMLLAWAEAA